MRKVGHSVCRAGYGGGVGEGEWGSHRQCTEGGGVAEVRHVGERRDIRTKGNSGVRRGRGSDF